MYKKLTDCLTRSLYELDCEYIKKKEKKLFQEDLEDDTSMVFSSCTVVLAIP